PDLGHPGRLQADNPLSTLSNFPEPPLIAKEKLDGTNVLMALTLNRDDFSFWMRERKSRYLLVGRPGYLSHIHVAAGKGVVDFTALRQRLKKLSKNAEATGDDISEEEFRDALYLPQAKWQARNGTGRSRQFVYDGDLYPEHRGKSFNSVSWFLTTVGKDAIKSLVHARMKSGWNLDDAISLPVIQEKGLIYTIECIPTGLFYVGLTTSPLERRFDFHCRAAADGSASILHRAIAEYGRDAFKVRTIETVEDEKALADREKYWIRELGTLQPDGMNVREGGQTGGFHGRKVDYEGRQFPSIAKAASTLSVEFGVPLYIATRYISRDEKIPSNPRSVQDHPDAAGGSEFNDLWRIHKSTLVRVSNGKLKLADEWRDYDRFKADVLPSRRAGLRLFRERDGESLGPSNFVWTTRQKIIECSHAMPVSAKGKEWSSVTALAEAYGIATSTMRFRLDKGMTPDEAVDLGPKGKTSSKEIEFKGVVYPSIRAAASVLAERDSIAVERARYVIRRSIQGKQPRHP
ncbi:hypothetical protein LCGC14_0801400, partial [marine sediment metagenome]